MSLPTTVGSVTLAAREAAIASLQQLLGDRLSTAASMRERHGKDASYHPCVPPDAVAFAQSTEEVSEIVKICALHKVPLIPFGSGTGLEGNVVALRGGVSLDLSQMNRILQVSTGDLDATVEAGVTHEPRRTSQLPFYRRQSLAMPATAIFTSALCSIRTILERWRRPNDSTNEWCSGRYRSTALAPVSTASAAARSISWLPSTARQ